MIVGMRRRAGARRNLLVLQRQHLFKRPQTPVIVINRAEKLLWPRKGVQIISQN